MATLPPIKNTVGEGFSVEEQVVASLACHLLAGLPWAGCDGATIRSIECQTRQDGWFFDDVLVRVEKNGIKQACGCSVKSYPVFKPNGASRKISVALWQQWQAPAPTPFRRRSDQLALIAAQHEPAIREAWIGLTESARAIPPESYAERLTSGTEPSSLRRKGFLSLKQGTPDRIEATAEETARLLRIVHLSEHDFHHTSSDSVTRAIALCQQALQDHARAQGSDLWLAIIECISPVRRKGGTITLPSLLAALAHRFPLKQHPSYASDWGKLEEACHNRIEMLPDRIGNSVALRRETLASRIKDKVASQQLVSLVGMSGNGKSVLARNWVRDGTGGALWLRAGDLSTTGGPQGAFKLTHDIATLINNSGAEGRLVLDGLDKCFDDEAFDEAARILAAVICGPARDRWQTLITCCPEDWERVQGKLLRRRVILPSDQVVVDRFTLSELRQTCAELPKLSSLIHRPHLWPLLCWPKVLDLAATHGLLTITDAKWTTEPGFARSFWEEAIYQNGSSSIRDRTGRLLAVYLGDTMRGSRSMDDFTSAEADVLIELSREGHVLIDRNRNTVRFSHDLLGDWARLRELQVQAENVSVFIQKRLHSPLWHQAIRLFAINLLERNDHASAYQKLFEQFSSGSTADALAQNLMLEAPVFAADPANVLNSLWPIMQAENGSLLRRFLRQFRQVATNPDDRALGSVEEKDTDLRLEIAAIYRIPWIPYWLGVLRFLGDHAEDIIVLAREEIADICLLWLPLQPVFPDLMQPMASMAVGAAKRFYRSPEREHHQHHNRTSAEEKVCQALLLAAPTLPEATTELALKLSGRLAPAQDEELPERERPRSRFWIDPGPPQPWPEGPQRECSPAFRSAIMDGRYAIGLFRAVPDVAAEALFGVLLDIPFGDPRFDGVTDLDEHGFERGDRILKSSFWTNGPFVAFLNANPQVALSTIIRLVNFATERATELPEDLRERIVVPVRVGEVVSNWKGTQWALLWHKGHVFGPRAVCCALLSLEFWFYQLQDNKQPIETHLRTILEQSRSIALAGVLITVGKRDSNLFLGPLRPLVEAVELHWIERNLRRGDEDSFMACNFDSFGSERHLVHEWVQKPHRKELLGDLVLRQFLSDPTWRAMIEDISTHWKARLDKTPPEQSLANILSTALAQFDLENWGTKQHKDRIEISFKRPSHLPGPTTEEQASMERTQLLLFLPFECRQILHGERPSSVDKIGEWWNSIERIRNIDLTEQDTALYCPEDALLGIISVSLICHREWLAGQPEREALARELLITTGLNQPTKSWFPEDGICDHKWDNFAAWGMTTLWCENPQDPVLRQGVGSLVMWDRHLVVERVMRIAGANRKSLGEHFDHLLTHAIRYAPIRDDLKQSRFDQKSTFDPKKALMRHLDSFIKNKTPALPSDWRTLAKPKKSRNHQLSRGLDIEQLVTTLSWAENLDSAADPTERLAWIELHRQTLSCAILRIQAVIAAPEEEDDPIDSIRDRWPLDDEQKVLKRVAQIVARLETGESQPALWQSLYALGRPAEHWIERFITNWFLESTGQDEIQPNFSSQWAEFLEFAMNAPSWKQSNGRFGSHSELTETLLGMRMLGGNFWREDLACVLEAVRTYHEGWAHDHVDSSYHAPTYLYFLCNPAARNLRLEGLKILHQHVPVNDNRFWREDRVAVAFGRLLSVALSENASEIAEDQNASSAFIAFALKLTSLQHPLGHELLTAAGKRFAAPS